MSPRITLWTALVALASSLSLSAGALAASNSAGAIVSVDSEVSPMASLATEAAK